jgi:hypothetical protein
MIVSVGKSSLLYEKTAPGGKQEMPFFHSAASVAGFSASTAKVNLVSWANASDQATASARRC